MYGKTYESMYQGSMVGAGLNVFAVWNYIITNTHFGVIELNPKLVAAILGGEIGEIEGALDFLGSPEPESRNKAEGGRRIVKEGQFQYRVVNWWEYQAMRTAEDLREYNRRKQAEYRARKKAEKTGKGHGNGPLRGEGGALRALGRGDQAEYDRLAAQGPKVEGGGTATVAGPACAEEGIVLGPAEPEESELVQ